MPAHRYIILSDQAPREARPISCLLSGYVVGVAVADRPLHHIVVNVTYVDANRFPSRGTTLYPDTPIGLVRFHEHLARDFGKQDAEIIYSRLPAILQMRPDDAPAHALQHLFWQAGEFSLDSPSERPRLPASSRFALTSAR